MHSIGRKYGETNIILPIAYLKMLLESEQLFYLNMKLFKQ